MTDPKQPKPDRKSGFAHLVAAAGYSRAGMQRLMQESAFRQELLALPILLVAYAVLGASFAEFTAFGVLFLLLVAFEALNTAIETLVDHLTLDWAQFAKEAKDLGSLAVMCILISHGLLFFYILLT